METQPSSAIQTATVKIEVLVEKIGRRGGNALQDGEKRYVTQRASSAMPAIDFIGISPREKAGRRYPFSAKRNRIYSDGAFPLVIKRRVPWTIKLYCTAEERERALHSNCGASRCTLITTQRQEFEVLGYGRNIQ